LVARFPFVSLTDLMGGVKGIVPPRFRTAC